MQNRGSCLRQSLLYISGSAFLAVLGILVAAFFDIIQIGQTERIATQGNLAEGTQIALLTEQLQVQQQLLTAQASGNNAAPDIASTLEAIESSRQAFAATTTAAVEEVAPPNDDGLVEPAATLATILPTPSLASSNSPAPCNLTHLAYRDTRTSSPLQSGFHASIGHNDNGSVKIFLSGQGETYRNYYTFTGDCTSSEKVALLKGQFQYIESNTRQYVPGFNLREPTIVH